MDKVLHNSKGRLAYALVAVSWLVYAGVSILAPRGGNTYHINPTNFILIQLSIIVPVLFIWLTAIYGAVKFRAYSTIIHKSPDGLAIHRITTGLYLLITSFIVQTLLAVISRLSVGTPMLDASVLLHNHVPVVLSLISVFYIFSGSTLLVRVVSTKIRWSELIAMLVGFSAAAGLLGWYLYNNISHTVTNGVPNFTLPGHVPFYTMFVPYLIAWLLSLLSILNILSYTRNVKGSIYRKGLKYAASGIVVIVTFAMSLQILTFLANALAKWHLNSLLVLVYGILIVYALGFVLIAVGARKLARIEVVQ